MHGLLYAYCYYGHSFGESIWNLEIPESREGIF